MYCENCGNEIEKDSEFCVYCGEKVKKDMGIEAVLMAGNMNRKKKYRKGIIAAVITTAMLLAVFVGVWIHNAPARRLAEQLDLGNRYLEEMDYEQAVVAFTKAIEIDPMSVDAYIGAAEAYVGLDDVDGAIAVLEKGHVLTDNEDILQLLEELRERREKETRGTEEVVESMLEENDEDALPYFELGFSPKDFSIAGYSIMDGDHLNDVEEAAVAVMPNNQDIIGEDLEGWCYYTSDYNGHPKIELWYKEEGGIVYGVTDTDIISIDVWGSVYENSLYKGKVTPYVISYEETLESLGIQQLILALEEKADGEGLEFESQYGKGFCHKVESDEDALCEYGYAISCYAGERQWAIYVGFEDNILGYIDVSLISS